MKPTKQQMALLPAWARSGGMFDGNNRVGFRTVLELLDDYERLLAVAEAAARVVGEESSDGNGWRPSADVLGELYSALAAREAANG